MILVARSEDKLNKLKEDLERVYAVPVMVITKDLALPGAPKEVYEEVKSAGLKIDILVNNAGVGSFGPFVSSDWKEQENMIRLNILALAELTRLFLPGMVSRRRGKIINLSSTAAFEPGPLMSVYYASKAFVLSFSEALSRELKGTGVTVTALCPGPTNTGFATAAKLKKSKLYKFFRATPAIKVAQYGIKAAENNKVVAVHGLGNKLLVAAIRFIPRAVVREIAWHLQGKTDKPQN